MKVGARVVPGSIQRVPGGREYAFNVTDGAKIVPVVYRGIAPDTFTDSVDVVVEGRMGQDGTFHATTLLAKCASRYENAPDDPDAPGMDKYQQTPGYKAAAGTKRVILIGELSLWVALLMAAWSTTVSFAGGAMRRDDLIDSGGADCTPRSR